MDWFLIIWAAYFILFGMAFIVRGFSNIRLALYTKTWQYALGTITRSELSEDLDSEGEKLYKFVIEYSYTLDGTEYKGKTIFIGDGFYTNDKSKVDEYLKKFVVFQRVSVYYNPKKPKMSVLEKGLNKYILRGFFIGILCILIAIIGYILVSTQ